MIGLLVFPEVDRVLETEASTTARVFTAKIPRSVLGAYFSRLGEHAVTGENIVHALKFSRGVLTEDSCRSRNMSQTNHLASQNRSTVPILHSSRKERIHQDEKGLERHLYLTGVDNDPRRRLQH
jgi:hypothetical protein